MAIKIENQSTTKLPRGAEELIRSLFESVPREHTRGIERVRLVDVINDPRLRPAQNAPLPGLYHPRQSAKAAWLEVSTDALLSPAKPFHKRMIPRLSFRGNLAAVIISLIGQHYYLTMRHSVKKGQIESSVRAYTEKHLRLWSVNEHRFRARLFRPLQPLLEKWARKLQKQAVAEKKKPGRL